MSKLQDDWKILESKAKADVYMEFLHSESKNRFKILMSKGDRSIQKEFDAVAPLNDNEEPCEHDTLRLGIVAVSMINDLVEPS